MKYAFTCFFISLASLVNAHDYFFAFAEMEYDELNGRIETTLTVSNHDFEHYLKQKNIIQHDLNFYKNDSLKIESIENELNTYLTLNIYPFSENSSLDGDESFHFNLDGFETQLSGTVLFYLSADVKRPLETIEVRFDLLMDDHPEQQNKLTFIHRGQKRTYVFLPAKRTQIIDLY